MIYITGDTHGTLDISKLSKRNFPNQKFLTKEDYIIICGDFGLIWNKSQEEINMLEKLSNKNFTTLFIDGNHENFDLLYQYPLVEKFGGQVHEITPSIYHLCRSEIYNIDGHSFFTLGGARSHDKAFREEYVSWWKEEMPNYEEYEKALRTLSKNKWKVDYVLTHCAPFQIQKIINPNYEPDVLSIFLGQIAEKLEFKKWFFGHYHVNCQIENYQCLYNEIIHLI